MPGGPFHRAVRPAIRVALPIGGAGVALLLGWAVFAWERSRLPETYDAMAFAAAEYGTAPHGTRGHDHARHHDRVASLKGPRGNADFRTTIVAQKRRITLPSGKAIEAWTFDGRIPGRELRVRHGDLVEVTLVNRDIDDGVSIHWHGLDIPNAEDGVAGITQDAVPVGGRHTYRFRVTQTGTFWYHAHQHSAKAVKRGLYGSFISLPASAEAQRGLDLTVPYHRFGGAHTLGATDTVNRRRVAAGTPVRLRLINTDSAAKDFAVTGAAFRVVAIDGTDVAGATALSGRTLEIAAGGRYDVAFTMPDRSVGVAVRGTSVALSLSRDGRAAAPPAEFGPQFDPATYGEPHATLLASRRPDRHFDLAIGRRPGFRDGKLGLHWTLNGKIYPHMPMLMVGSREVVTLTIRNRTKADHPMHLHGHHMLVLERDGVRVKGAPWWVDTINIRRDETYKLAFQTTNRGVWMLHCHDLNHAADGLTTHVAYDGVDASYAIGGAAKNQPE